MQLIKIHDKIPNLSRFIIKINFYKLGLESFEKIRIPPYNFKRFHRSNQSLKRFQCDTIKSLENFDVSFIII